MSEKHSIDWSKFKIFLKEHVPDSHYKAIIRKLEKSMEQLHDKYQILEQIQICRDNILSDPGKNYTFIKKLNDTMKLNRVNKKDLKNKSRLTAESVCPSDNIRSSQPSTSSMNNGHIEESITIVSSDDSSSEKEADDKNMSSPDQLNNVNDESIKEDLDSLDPEERKRKLKIRELEKLFKNCKSKICSLEEAEIEMNDLNDDNSQYIKLHKYKTFALKVWKQIRKLENQSYHTGRLTSKKFSFCGSSYSSLNVAITNLVNVHGEIKFPDFRDVNKCVKQFNSQENMKWTPNKIHEESMNNFRKLLNRLKDIRKEDFHRDFGCHLTDIPFNDPYDTDTKIRQQLNKSREEGIQKLDELLEKFTNAKESELSSDSEVSADASNIDDSSTSSDDPVEEETTPAPDTPASHNHSTETEQNVDPNGKPTTSQENKFISSDRKRKNCGIVHEKPSKMRRVQLTTLSNNLEDPHKNDKPSSPNLLALSQCRDAPYSDCPVDMSAASSPASFSSSLIIDLESPVNPDAKNDTTVVKEMKTNRTSQKNNLGVKKSNPIVL